MFNETTFGNDNEGPWRPEADHTMLFQPATLKQTTDADHSPSGGGMTTLYMPGAFQQPPSWQSPGSIWGAGGLLAGRDVPDAAVLPLTQTMLWGRKPQDIIKSESQSADKYAPSPGWQSGKSELGEHPFVLAYLNHIDRYGDPVEGVAQRKQMALDRGESLVDYDMPPVQPGTYEGASGRTGGGQITAGSATPFSPTAKQHRPSIGDRDADSGPMAEKTVGFKEDKTEQVTGRNWRYLTEMEKNTMGNYYPRELLDDIKLHVGERVWFQPKDKAMTLGNHVYLGGGVQPDVENQAYIGLLGHEIQHTQQYRNGMTQGGYVLELLNKSILHGSVEKGYYNNNYEVDARNMEGRIRSGYNFKPLQESVLSE